MKRPVPVSRFVQLLVTGFWTCDQPFTGPIRPPPGFPFFAMPTLLTTVRAAPSRLAVREGQQIIRVYPVGGCLEVFPPVAHRHHDIGSAATPSDVE